MKKLKYIQRGATPHWVGDGFPVRSIFTYQDQAKDFSPFLLMDHAGPAEFPPTRERKGVGEHPHRGFETVTLVYSGEVEHRDSAGGGGTIGPGDVQWMTAASGLVHEEFHGRNFAKSGGLFEMVQLWVNLPAKDKSAPPKYQGLLEASQPKLDLPAEAGTLRVVAGEFEGKKGPALTFTPMNLWDLRLKAGKAAKLRLPVGHNSLVFVLQGEIVLGTGEKVVSGELAVMEREGEKISLSSALDAKILILTGEPINEPVVGYGPFVMNSWPEIQRAFEDFERGKMGQLVQSKQ